jgi:hypothetical protein
MPRLVMLLMLSSAILAGCSKTETKPAPQPTATTERPQPTVAESKGAAPDNPAPVKKLEDVPKEATPVAAKKLDPSKLTFNLPKGWTKKYDQTVWTLSKEVPKKEGEFLDKTVRLYVSPVEKGFESMKTRDGLWKHEQTSGWSNKGEEGSLPDGFYFVAKWFTSQVITAIRNIDGTAIHFECIDYINDEIKREVLDITKSTKLAE